MNQRKAGVILSYLSEAVQILTALLYTPVMLRLLGQSEYGLYQLVYSVVSYLSLLSLGFGSSYMRYYSRYKADHDIDGVSRLNGMFLLIFGSLSIICILCGLVMIHNIRSIFGTGLTDLEYKTATVLMALMVVNLAMTFPNSVFNCAISAHERFIFQKVLTLVSNLFSPFLTLPLLIMGVGSIGMVSVTTFLTFSRLVFNIFYCARKLHMQFCFTGLKFALLKDMWVFTFFIFLNSVIDQVNWSVDKFLLGRISGTTAVAVYGVGGQVNSLYIQLSTSISSVFIPQVNRIVAETNDNDALTKLFTKIGRVQFILMSLILTGFIFVGQAFVIIWAGNGYASSYFVTLLLIVPVTVPLIQNLGIEIQRAKNMHKARSVVYFCIAIGNILLSIPLIKMFGPAGAALGTAIALTIGNIGFMNWYYHKRIGLNMVYFWKNIASFIPALIAPVICGICIRLFFSMNSVISLCIAILIYGVVYCLSVYFIGMNEYEKTLINKPIKKMFHG